MSRSVMTAKIFERLGLGSIVALTCFVAGGCSTTYQVKVDAISKPNASEAVSFRIRNKSAAATGEESLRESEVSGYIRTALSGRGMYEAPTNETADMVVEVDFGIEPPRTKMEQNHVPVYAQVGGGVRYGQIPVVDSRGRSSMRTVTVYEPPRTELVGYHDVVVPVTVYEKYLNIRARDNSVVVEGQPAQEIWSVRISNEDESNDLRKYLPILASASIEHIGTDTTSQKIVKIRERDPSVAFIRKGM